VSKGLAEKRERSIVTADEIVAGLVYEARREGPGSTHAARVSAWTTLAKIHGLLLDKIQLEDKRKGPPEPAIVTIVIEGAPIETKENILPALEA